MHTPMAQATRALCPGYPHSAVSWSTGRRVVVVPDSVAGRVQRALAVSRAHASMSSPSPVKIQKLYRDPNPVVRAVASVVALLRRVAGHCCVVSQPLVSCVVTLGLPLLSRYNRLSHDTPRQPGHARARCFKPLRVGRPCRGPCWPCCGAVSRVAGHVVAPCCTPQLPYVTIQAIVS